MAAVMPGKRTFSFEFFPPKTRRGHGEAARHAPPAGAARAHVLLRHVRRGRHHARGHPRGRARDPRRGAERRAAHLVHRQHAGELARGDRAVQGQRHSPHRGTPRRPALGPRRGGRVPLRLGAGALHPRGDRRLVPRRGGVLSGVPPAGPQAGARPRRVQGQGGRGRERRHHAVFLQCRRVFPLRRARAGDGHRRSRSSPA